MLGERPARDGGAGAKEELSNRARDGMQTAERHCHKFWNGSIPSKVWLHAGRTTRQGPLLRVLRPRH
ncbi:MAG: hypothetical protein CMQ15_15015 [Gammaproteobacteria bacterium]|nr:hypothetical protein [Gammaproteobacteria bacterium]